MRFFSGVALLFFVANLASCKVEPAQINYGSDACSYCSMTIVNHQHASQLVTSKGKVYKYDAIECLINDLDDRDSSSVGLLLVSDYSNPGNLIPALSATFIISEEIPSPMGAFLSAFNNREAAELIKSERGGSLYNWQLVKEQIQK